MSQGPTHFEEVRERWKMFTKEGLFEKKDLRPAPRASKEMIEQFFLMAPIDVNWLIFRLLDLEHKARFNKWKDPEERTV